MAHEIGKDDEMFSVREKPWHGLGDILDDAPTVEEARKSYLTWGATQVPLEGVVKDRDPITQETVYSHVEVPNKFGIMREDTRKIIGVVGGRYSIYQNSEMWDFIEEFADNFKIDLETAGSLRDGETTWVLCKGADFEVITGDPISQYMLFRNAFNGGTPISVLFTNIRVVCNNTLSGALRNATNIYNVRHVGNVAQHMAQVNKALKVQEKYQKSMIEALETLSKKQMTEEAMKAVLEESIFPKPAVNEQTVGGAARSDVLTFTQNTGKVNNVRKNKVNRVLYLVENGSGADVAGVRGTAYGLYQSIIEWSDHERALRLGSRIKVEASFENAMLTTQEFKKNAMEVLLKAA